jgi:hypothetical protein
MTVRELIKELLHYDMDAEVSLSFKNGEFGDNDADEPAECVKEHADPAMNEVYICTRDRKGPLKY